jgi:6-phosphogluconolactonase/glucosamine-6-phosphate isomerase/deaminase
VCSLFPGHRLLRERERLVAPIEDSPKPPPRRLTLTLPALWSAELLVVAAVGEAKAAVLKEALDDPRSELPVALALRRARRAVVLLRPPRCGAPDRLTVRDCATARARVTFHGRFPLYALERS